MLHDKICCAPAVAHGGSEAILLLYELLVRGSLCRAGLLITTINVCCFSALPTRRRISTKQKFMPELSPPGRKVLLEKCWQAPKNSIVREG